MARLHLCLAALLLLVGCPQAQESKTSATGAPAAGAAAAPTEADREEAKSIFSTRCAVCHGEKGAGDGSASSGLDPKPRDFTQVGWQDSVTDEFIEKIIKYGGAAVQKSPAMPGNPDLSSKANVVAALREHVRGLRAK